MGLEVLSNINAAYKDIPREVVKVDTNEVAKSTDVVKQNIAETTVLNIKDMLEKGQCANEVCYRCGITEDCKNTRCF